jgi:phosphoadenosine phosphosulfate reductase
MFAARRADSALSLPVPSPMSTLSQPSRLRVVSPDMDRTEEKRPPDVIPISSLEQPARPAVQANPEAGPELQAELVAKNQELESAAPEVIIQWGVERFGRQLTMATAFGPEGMVILDMLAKIAPQTHVFNLDTGYQFNETLALREQVLTKYGMAVELVRAATTVAEFEAANGGPVYKVDPNRCCWERKISVLQNAVVGKGAWITAIRRDQSPDRAQAPVIGWDKKFNLVKINPLANWTKNQVWKYITDHDVPYNPLHDQGYTSIGCWPCTRAVLFGEDERAGRWSGTAKTECGLHG